MKKKCDPQKRKTRVFFKRAIALDLLNYISNCHFNNPCIDEKVGIFIWKKEQKTMLWHCMLCKVKYNAFKKKLKTKVKS